MLSDNFPTLLIIAPEHVVDFIRACILHKRYRVEASLNEKDAKILARQLQPNLIIVDGEFISGDSVEICRQLYYNSLIQKVPIILLNSSEYDVSSYVDEDIYLLKKPFDAVELLGLIKGLCQQGADTHIGSNPVIGVRDKWRGWYDKDG